MSPLPTDPYTFANGAGNTADALQVNARFNALFGALSAGGLDPAVFAAGIIPASKLAADAKAQAGAATASGVYTLTNTLTDVPGVAVTFTPPVPSLLVAVGFAAYRFSLASPQTGIAHASLDLDGSQVGFVGRGGFVNGSGGQTAGADGQLIPFAVYDNLPATAHTLKLRAKCDGPGGFLDNTEAMGALTGLYYFTVPT